MSSSSAAAVVTPRRKRSEHSSATKSREYRKKLSEGDKKNEAQLALYREQDRIRRDGDRKIYQYLYENATDDIKKEADLMKKLYKDMASSLNLSGMYCTNETFLNHSLITFLS